MAAFAPAFSGPILAFLLEALDLRARDTEGALSQTNARRYLRGERVSPEARRLIHRAIASALVETELVPSKLDLAVLIHPDQRTVRGDGGRELAIDAVDAVEAIIRTFADHWDELAGVLRRRTAPIAFPKLMAGACIRLLVPDLAVRICGVLWLMQVPGDEPMPRFWYEKRGIETWVRSLVERCAPRLTRDRLAELVGVHPNSVDAWLDQGTRPTEENLRDLACVLGDHGHDRARLLRSLRLAFAARHVVQRVDEIVGGHAEEAAARLVAWSNMMLIFPRGSRNPRENDYKMGVAVLAGTFGMGGQKLPWVESMLKPAWRREPDPTWRTSIVAATTSWLDNLQFVAARLGSNTQDEIQALFGDDPPQAILDHLIHLTQASPSELARHPALAGAKEAILEVGGDVAATEYKSLAWEAGDRGDLLGAIGFLRRAVACNELDADAHFRLGAVLGQLGDVDGALGELEISVRLDPVWDRPRVEIGIVLLNSGRDSDAVLRLEAAQGALAEPSGWLLFHLAVAHEQVGNREAAITDLERLLEIEPEHGEAHDRLAHLCLVTGESRKGRAHAKQAAHLGFDTVFAALEAGYYRGPGPKARPPDTLSGDMIQSRARPRSEG